MMWFALVCAFNLVFENYEINHRSVRVSNLESDIRSGLLTQLGDSASTPRASVEHINYSDSLDKMPKIFMLSLEEIRFRFNLRITFLIWLMSSIR